MTKCVIVTVLSGNICEVTVKLHMFQLPILYNGPVGFFHTGRLHGGVISDVYLTFQCAQV